MIEQAEWRQSLMLYTLMASLADPTDPSFKDSLHHPVPRSGTSEGTSYSSGNTVHNSSFLFQKGFFQLLLFLPFTTCISLLA